MQGNTEFGTVKLEDVKAGDHLIADDGFTCIGHGASLVVDEDNGGLFVPCSAGKHYLDGQLDDDGYLAGLRRA